MALTLPSVGTTSDVIQVEAVHKIFSLRNGKYFRGHRPSYGWVNISCASYSSGLGQRRIEFNCGALPRNYSLVSAQESQLETNSGTEFINYAPAFTGPPEGNTAGALLLVDDVTVSAGSTDLITGVTFTLMPGEKRGLVGANGCGKSTLLKTIIGNHPFDTGKILVGYGTKLGYLEQTAVSGSSNTVWEEAGSRMEAINAAQRELSLAELAVENSEEGALDRFAVAQETFEAMDGYKQDEMIAGVLTGLGFEQSDWTRPATEFSGGWQMRIALARLLLGQLGQSDHSLLLLDEPTNHLDSKAKVWLSQYLRNFSGGMIIVSHDELLLENACNCIGEVRGGKYHSYVGNYSKFLREREARQVALAQEIARKQEQVDKLQGFVDRFGAQATKASAANSRKKAIAKIMETMPDQQSKGQSGSGGDKRKSVVKFPPPPVCAKEILALKKGFVGYSPHNALLKDVDIRLDIGTRMVILGPNGCGKSSLLKALSGKAPTLLSGDVLYGDGAEIGVFTQDLAQDLPLEKSGMDYVLEIAREKDLMVTNETARSALGALGLTGESALRPIRELSGGEKARVALGAFSVRAHNVLLMDEASNHLDRSTVKALGEALNSFKGALVMITHDKEFCEFVKPTHVARVHPNGSVSVRLSINGELTEADFDPEAVEAPQPIRGTQNQPKKGQPAGAHQSPNGTPNGALNGAVNGTGGGRSPKEDRKRLQQVQNRVKKVVEQIEKGESACAKFDEELMAAGSNAARAMEIAGKKAEVEAKVRELEKEWEKLEQEAEELRALVAP